MARAPVFGTLTQTALPGQAGFLTTQNGFNAGIGTVFNPITTNNDYIPANTKWPMIQSWVFSLQREIAKDTVVEIAYNGNHSSRLPVIGDWNQANPNAPGGTLSVQARRPDQAFGAITWVDPVGINDFNGFSVRFEKRFSRGLYVLNSFTWGHSIGDSERALEQAPGQNVANPQNIYNLAAEFGPSSYDVKLNNVTSVVYQLPIGKGRTFLKGANRIEELVIGGWEPNAINMANTGLPLNVYYAPSTANDVTGLPTNSEYRGTAILRPNVSGPLPSETRTQQIADYFGPTIGSAGSVFTLPTPDQPFGNLGRNAFRGPGFWQWDLGVTNNVNFTERFRVQFRSEFFNVLNRTNPGVPNQPANSTAFGSITGTFPARQIQFGVKAMF